MSKAKMTEYRSWQSMKARCYNKNHTSYKNYGGRGLTVCDRWLNSFETFLDDLGYKLNNTYTLERIDNSKGYSKENCKWGTKTEQSNNRRCTKFITLNNETLSISDWARKMKVPYMTIRRRMEYGWSEHDAVFTPVKKDLDCSQIDVILKLFDMGVKVADIAYISKVQVSAIYKTLKKNGKKVS